MEIAVNVSAMIHLWIGQGLPTMDCARAFALVKYGSVQGHPYYEPLLLSVARLARHQRHGVVSPKKLTRATESLALNLAQFPEGDWLSPIGGGHALHISATHEERRLESKAYRRGSSVAGLEKGGLGAVSVEVGYDTSDPRDEVRRLFVAGILAWEPTDAITLRSTVGSHKCVAGVCRDFPEFSGARLEIVGRGDLL